MINPQVIAIIEEELKKEIERKKKILIEKAAFQLSYPRSLEEKKEIVDSLIHGALASGAKSMLDILDKKGMLK